MLDVHQVYKATESGGYRRSDTILVMLCWTKISFRRKVYSLIVSEG